MIQNQNYFVSGSYPPQHRCHHPPGELGKALGLDRVPEVRTLREKITRMAATGNPGQWMRDLAKTRMQDDPAEAGYLYIDGHVRVHHGRDAKLPRCYVSRQKLCLRGTTDYWINDALGRPFFVVSKAITETQVPCPGGGTIPIRLARRETELTARKAVPVPLLEVRRLTESGHQTAIITTARSLASPTTAGRMFSRWC